MFAPVAFALFVIAIVWPFQSWLQAALPKVLALAISIIVTTVVIIAFGSLIAWGFSRVVRYVISDATRLQGLYTQMSDWLETHGIMLAGLWAEHFNVSWLIRLLPGVTNRVNSTTTFLFVVLIYVILGLLEVDDVARKLGAIAGAGDRTGAAGGKQRDSREAPPVHARSNPDERHDRRTRVGVCRLHRARTRA